MHQIRTKQGAKQRDTNLDKNLKQESAKIKVLEKKLPNKKES